MNICQDQPYFYLLRSSNGFCSRLLTFTWSRASLNEARNKFFMMDCVSYQSSLGPREACPDLHSLSLFIINMRTTGRGELFPHCVDAV